MRPKGRRYCDIVLTHGWLVQEATNARIYALPGDKNQVRGTQSPPRTASLRSFFAPRIVLWPDAPKGARVHATFEDAGRDSLVVRYWSPTAAPVTPGEPVAVLKTY